MLCAMSTKLEIRPELTKSRVGVGDRRDRGYEFIIPLSRKLADAYISTSIVLLVTCH